MGFHRDGQPVFCPAVGVVRPSLESAVGMDCIGARCVHAAADVGGGIPVGCGVPARVFATAKSSSDILGRRRVLCRRGAIVGRDQPFVFGRLRFPRS